MSSRRIRILWVAFTLLLSLLAHTGAHAVVTPGTPCKKAGSKEIYKGKTYTCIKLGKKLYWNNGKLVKISPSPIASVRPSQSPSTQISPTPLPSKSSDSSITSTVKLLETYFGKTDSMHCWVVNRLVNTGLQLSPRLVVIQNPVSDKGLNIPIENFTYVPSLPPGSEHWSFQRSYCSDDVIGVIRFDSIKPYDYYSANEVDRTSTEEIPKVISFVDRNPNSNFVTKGRFELKVQNLSKSKDVSSQTLVHVIFIGADGKPVSGAKAQLNRSVPPLTTGTLSFPDFDIGLYEIPRFSRIIVNLEHKLCSGAKCSY